MTLHNMPKLQVTIRSVDESPVIRYNIDKQFMKLLKHWQRIEYCKVVIDAEQKHKHKGKMYTVAIDLTLPGQILVCKKRDMNLYVAIRDAFMTLQHNITRRAKRNINPIDMHRQNKIYSDMSDNHPDFPNAS